MGRTTSSKDDTDRNVAVAASHASSLGVMMFESVVVVVVGVDFWAEEASEDFSNDANGIPLFTFSPPFFASLPSPFFTHVRPWRMVGCCFLQVWHVGLLAQPFAECPLVKQWKHSWHDASFWTLASTSLERSWWHSSVGCMLLQTLQRSVDCTFSFSQNIVVGWWIFTRCHCCHRRGLTLHTFVALNDDPCFNHVDKVVERKWDALQIVFMMLFPKFVCQMWNSFIDDFLQ